MSKGMPWNPCTPEGGGTPGDDVCCLVYRQGEPNPEGNVFADFGQLAVVAQAVDGVKTILFDDSLVSPMTIPEGDYDLNAAVLIAKAPGQGPGGSTFVNPQSARLRNVLEVAGNLLIQNVAVGAGASTFVLLDGEELVVSAPAALGTAVGAPPCVTVPAGSGSLRLDGGRLRFLGAPCAEAQGTAALGIGVRDGGRVNADVLASPVGAAISVGVVGEEFEAGILKVSRDQANALGGVTYSFPNAIEAPFQVKGAVELDGIGHVFVSASPAELPPAAEHAGPLWVHNDVAGNLILNANALAGDNVDGAAALRFRRNGCALLKSDGADTWRVVCGRRVQQFSFQSAVIASLGIGVDFFLAFNGLGFTGGIDVTGVIGTFSRFRPCVSGRAKRVCIESSVALGAGVTLELVGRINGGAFVTLATVVGPVAAGVATFLEIPGATFEYTEPDDIEFALRLTAGGPILATQLLVTLDLESDP